MCRHQPRAHERHTHCCALREELRRRDAARRRGWPASPGPSTASPRGAFATSSRTSVGCWSLSTGTVDAPPSSFRMRSRSSIRDDPVGLYPVKTKGMIRSLVRRGSRSSKHRVPDEVRSRTVCERCAAVYLNRTWRRGRRLALALTGKPSWSVCPACRQVEAGEYRERDHAN